MSEYVSPSPFYRYVLESPEQLEGRKGKPPMLRFDVRIETAEEPHYHLMTIYGFRVGQGRLLPPARKNGASWTPTANMSFEAMKGFVTQAAETWAGDFPGVRFV